MNISELSIRRPVLATVLTIIILLFGLIGYNTLGVREYPSVDNPIISVSCSYSGANADVIENQITEPLEQNINGIPGIRSLSSVSQQGQCRITVEFELSVIVTVAPFPIATPATFLISRSSVAFLPFSISPVNFLGIIFLCPSFHVFSSMLPSIPSAPDLPSDPSHIPVGSAAMPPLRSPGHKTLQFR